MVDHSTPEIEELIGAYALDAVDDDERAVVEQHLAVCARCRAELIEHREVAALLAYDGNPAPADLWDRIAESLDEPPPALRLEVARQPEVASLDERRRSKFQRGMYIALAGVAAALALVLGVVIARDDSSTAPSTELAQVAEEALADPASSTVTLRPASGEGPEVTAVVTPNGDGFVLAPGLPALSEDRTYQLWGVDGDQAISLGVLGADPDVVSFRVDDPGNFSAFAITEEVSGGVVSSQNAPVVVGEVA
jgi:anti-sigma factor RsiW